MNDLSGLAWFVVLLAVNAFFVAAEFAVISARRSQVEPAALAGKRSAKTALYAMENVSLMLATSQLGITVASLLILNVAEPSIHHLISDVVAPIGWPESVVGAISFGLALIVVTFLHVVLGEMVPKNASFSVPDRAILLLAGPLVLVARVVKPLIIALDATAGAILRLFRVQPKSEATSAFTLEQVAAIVSQSTRAGTLEDSAGALSAAFEFTAKKAGDIQVPLTQLVSLPEAARVIDLESAVAEHGFSRYLIRSGSGELVGYVHLKDVLSLDDDFSDAGTDTGPIKTKRVRQLVTMAESTDLEDALAELQRSGVHLARVVNHAGETTGVLFLEDIIEELVGEVHDVTQRVRPTP